MTAPYPLRTEPLFRDYLWGGRKLESVLGKSIPADGVWAESWEMIDHSEHASRITNGIWAGKTLRNIAHEHPQWLFGNGSHPLAELPLLFKYLDCQSDLSVQVHPDDTYATRMPVPDLGKTEAWYIVAAEPGAKLYAGLAQGVGIDELQAAIAAGTVERCLHEIQPSAGDCVFIPAGTVHALGAGLLVAEIQQASNTTFRLFDWNRVDANVQARELHIEQALQVIDFESGPRELSRPQSTAVPGRQRLVNCDKFIFDRLHGVDVATVAGDNKFHLLSAPYGGVTLTWTSITNGVPEHFSEILQVGNTVLLPAAMPQVKVGLSPTAVLLDMYLPT
jgi:mannose-6-phosphate isomerase